MLPGMTAMATTMMNGMIKKINWPSIPELVDACREMDVKFIALVDAGDTLVSKALVKGKEQKLTSKEAGLLRLLCTNVNEVLERSVALNRIWNDDSYKIPPDQTQRNLTGITFRSRNDGWICGTVGIILHTSDGGHSWGRQANGLTTDDFYKIAFSDLLHGYAVGRAGLPCRPPTVPGRP